MLWGIIRGYRNVVGWVDVEAALQSAGDRQSKGKKSRGIVANFCASALAPHNCGPLGGVLRLLNRRSGGMRPMFAVFSK